MSHDDEKKPGFINCKIHGRKFIASDVADIPDCCKPADQRQPTTETDACGWDEEFAKAGFKRLAESNCWSQEEVAVGLARIWFRQGFDYGKERTAAAYEADIAERTRRELNLRSDWLEARDRIAELERSLSAERQEVECYTALEHRYDDLRAEVEAYKKAKEENDERFQLTIGFSGRQYGKGYEMATRIRDQVVSMLPELKTVEFVVVCPPGAIVLTRDGLREALGRSILNKWSLDMPRILDLFNFDDLESELFGPKL